MLLLDTKSDDSRSNSRRGSMYNVGRFNSSIADEAIYGWAYREYYERIYRCNQVFDNVPNIDMDSELKERLLGRNIFYEGTILFSFSEFVL
ncbi:MAG: hypothetical protein R2771_07650 [Saprospiraceae bacterium]